MSEFLIIHYSPGSDNDFFYWALGGDQHPSVTLGHGSIQELAPIARGKKVTVLLDAHYTTLQSINVPSKNRSKQMLAIPFAMEDYLAEDIDEMHFVIGKSSRSTTDENKVPVIAIKRSRLQQTLDFFKQHGIHTDVISADSLALPTENNQWCVLLDDQMALIKTNDSQAHSCDRENLKIILSALLEQEKNQPERIQYHYNKNDTQAETLLNDLDIEVEIKTYQTHPLELFILNLNNLQNFNLLQGEFAIKRESANRFKPWKAAASIAGLWLVLQLGYSSVLAKQLEEKNRSLNKQIETEFKRAIPEARKMTNMKKRVERRLKDLNSGGKGSSNNQFLSLLSKASPALMKSDQFSIDTAAYKNNYIDFNITTSSLKTIESIKHKLDSIPGLKTVLSTSVEKKQVKARLRLESK